MANILDENTPVKRPGIFFSEFFKGFKAMNFPDTTYVKYLCKDYSLKCNDTPKYSPHLSVCIENIKRISVPKKSKYTSAVEITQQSFDDFYKMNYRRLQDESLDDAEFYENDTYDSITLYALQGKKLFCIFTEIDPAFRNICLCMDSSPGRFRSRTHKLKKIEPEVFKQAYHLLLELFYDPELVYQNFESAWSQLDALVHGDQPIHGIRINADVYFDNMIRAIKTRIRRMEKKLIDEDGTPEERARIRGELKGMEYCVKVINEHR